jgi:ribosomal protein S21
LPNENALADVLPLDIKPLHLPTFDRIVKSAFDDDVDAPDDEGDEEEDSDGSTSRSPSPDPQQELSPRALRAARRSGSLELPLPPTAEEEVKLVAAPVAPIEAPVEEAFEPFVETVGVVKDEEQEEDPFSYAQYDTSSDSDSSTFSSYVDRVVPLGGEGDAPVTPRPQLKPRKSALKTPPPPSSDEASPPSSALRSLKRKVSWHEQLNNYREIPHREDLPEVKRAKLEEEEAAARRAAELAKPMVTRRSSLVFVQVRRVCSARLHFLIAVTQEHPELHFAPSVSTPNAPSAAPSTPAAPVAQVSTTPKRAPTTPRVPHSAGRARVGPPAASVQRAVVATATTSDAMTTPRKTPLRKPGRSVSPVKRDVADTLFNFCPIDLEPPQVRGNIMLNVPRCSTAPQVRSDLAQLLASPLRKLGTFTLSPIKPPPLTLVGETPRTAPTVERLLAQIESIRKPLGTPSQPALAPFDLLGETPGQALLPMLSAAPAAPATPTPAAAVASAPSLQGISTPYLAGVRQLYKPAPPVVETPRFGGVKQLFHVPSVAVFSPQLEGVRELLISPEKPVEAVLETAHDVAIEEKPVVVVAEFEAREPARSILPVRAGPGRAKSASVEAKPSVVPKRAPRKPAAPVIAADLPEVGTATADAPVSSSSTSSAASRSTRSRSTSVSKPKATAATRTKPKATGGDVTSSTRLPARAKVKVADKENTSPVEPPVATLGGVGKASSLEPTTRSGRVLRSRKV